jgi:hypothetical protein
VQVCHAYEVCTSDKVALAQRLKTKLIYTLAEMDLLDHLVSYCDSTNDEATLMQTIEFNQNDMKKNIFPLVFLWIKTVIQKQISPG